MHAVLPRSAGWLREGQDSGAHSLMSGPITDSREDSGESPDPQGLVPSALSRYVGLRGKWLPSLRLLLENRATMMLQELEILPFKVVFRLVLVPQALFTGDSCQDAKAKHSQELRAKNSPLGCIAGPSAAPQGLKR